MKKVNIVKFVLVLGNSMYVHWQDYRYNRAFTCTREHWQDYRYNRALTCTREHWQDYRYNRALTTRELLAANGTFYTRKDQR